MLGTWTIAEEILTYEMRRRGVILDGGGVVACSDMQWVLSC